MKNERPDRGRVAITGIGLVTSLGCSLPSVLAAIRGGIANFIEHETVMVNGDRYGTELCGAQIARLPEDVMSPHVPDAERAVALLAPVLRECTASLSRDLLGAAQWRISNWIKPTNDDFRGNLRAALPDVPISDLARRDPGELYLGRCLFFEDLIQAASDLRDGHCPAVIVGSVDSLCTTTVLDRLCQAGKLKSGTDPEGIVAGEAAGAVVLELESHARRRNAHIYAYLCSWGRGVEADPWTEAALSLAEGLTKAFREAFMPLPGRGEEIEMLIADLNGERVRAYEWGCATARVAPSGGKSRELRHPADCVGDCGAAMGAVLLATSSAFTSFPLRSLKIALATSDDGGARRVICIEQESDVGRVEGISTGQRKRSIVLPAVIEQHSDEASYLWLIRNRLVYAPHAGLAELTQHDERIEAHLDGLRLADEAGWKIIGGALKSGFSEYVFATAVLAFGEDDQGRIRQVMTSVKNDREKACSLISALGWIPYQQAEPFIRNLFDSVSAFDRYVGIAATAIQRRNPGHILEESVTDRNPLLKERALFAIGELGLGAVMGGLLRENLGHDDASIRFSAAWSATLSGDAEAVEVLKSFVVPDSPYREMALNTLLRRMKQPAALSFQDHLKLSHDTLSLAVMGAGIIGDPVLVPWLLEQMKTPELARIAGEAFTMITGAVIDRGELRGMRPEGFEAGPNDDPNDCNVAMDEDEYLPWPDPELMAKWWDKNKGRYVSATRHLIGHPISAEHLRHVLINGRQRQRAAAALELAILEPGRPLFEVRAPGFRQIELLRDGF